MNVHGRITKEGSPLMRRMLVQAAHVAANRCPGDDATPFRSTFDRIRGTRGRKKVATVALARHILRIAYYIMRDGTSYDAARLGVEHRAAN